MPHLEHNGNGNPKSDGLNLWDNQETIKVESLVKFSQIFIIWLCFFCMVLFTFVNIPYDAWIINWTGDEKWTISRPLEVQHIFPVKSIPEKVSKYSCKKIFLIKLQIVKKNSNVLYTLIFWLIKNNIENARLTTMDE